MPEVFDIHIDRKPYQVSEKQMTGKQLRELAGLETDVHLYLEEIGDVEDEEIKDDKVVDLKPGQHFYSTPKTITPGHD
jgi:Multiubiquitin